MISPPKSDSEVMSADAVPEAVVPTSVCAEAVSPAVVATEPSLGYANDCPSAAPSGGAETAAPTAPDCPGTTTLIAKARAVAPAASAFDEAPADAAARATAIAASASVTGVRTFALCGEPQGGSRIRFHGGNPVSPTCPLAQDDAFLAQLRLPPGQARLRRKCEDRVILERLMETRRGPGTTEYAVLGLLAFGESSGYDLVRAASRSIDYMWAPSRSQIYKVLPRLVAWGLAESREVEQQDRPDKALYRITEAGLEELRSWIGTEEPDPPGGAAVFLMKLFFAWVAEPAAARTQLALYRRSVETHLAAFEEMERGCPIAASPCTRRSRCATGSCGRGRRSTGRTRPPTLLDSVAADETLDQASGGRARAD